MNIEFLSKIDFTALLALLRYVFAFVLSSASVGALFAVLINVAKSVGDAIGVEIIKPDQAPVIVKYLSFFLAIGLFAFKIYAPDLDFKALDEAAAALAKNILIALPFFMYIISVSAPVVHGVLKGIPVVGKSNSPVE